MNRLAVLALSTLVALALPGSAAALDITNGDVVVQNLTSFGFEQATGANVVTFDGATDDLYQLYGYLGNANGTEAVTGGAFTPTTAITQTGVDSATSVLSLDGGSALGLGAANGLITVQYDWLLVDDASPNDRDHLRWTVGITNNTGSIQSLSYYIYVDLDLEGAGDFGDDTATINLAKNRIEVGDADNPSRTTYWHSSLPYDHYQVGAYPGIRNLLDGMGAAGDLSDNLPLGATFGPADFTAAFQFDFTLNPGQTFRLVQVVPEPHLPALAALLGLGLFPSLARRPGRRS